MNKRARWYSLAGLLLLLAVGTTTRAAAFDDELLAIQQAWAVANYETAAGDARVAAFEKLAERAEAFVDQYPDRAEPRIWQGIVLSTYAGAKGGLGALKLAKRARSSLEKALTIDPDALAGSAYTSLGSLYYKVPGFPIGFGNDGKARELLEKALALNPDGIDPNYFYGEFLYEQKQRDEALQYLEKALHAPDRPGRKVADDGRREEIKTLIARIRAA